MTALSSSRVLGSWSRMAARARSGLRLAGMVASCPIIPSTRRDAVWIRAGIEAASGRLRQYFFGISALMAVGFTRAGLKTLS